MQQIGYGGLTRRSRRAMKDTTLQAPPGPFSQNGAGQGNQNTALARPVGSPPNSNLGSNLLQNKDPNLLKGRPKGGIFSSQMRAAQPQPQVAATTAEPQAQAAAAKPFIPDEQLFQAINTDPQYGRLFGQSTAQFTRGQFVPEQQLGGIYDWRRAIGSGAVKGDGTPYTQADMLNWVRRQTGQPMAAQAHAADPAAPTPAAPAQPSINAVEMDALTQAMQPAAPTMETAARPQASVQNLTATLAPPAPAPVGSAQIKQAILSGQTKPDGSRYTVLDYRSALNAERAGTTAPPVPTAAPPAPAPVAPPPAVQPGPFTQPLLNAGVPPYASQPAETPANAVQTPAEMERMRLELPDPQAFIDEQMAVYDAKEQQRLQREAAAMNEELQRRGVFSAGTAAEMTRRMQEESNRARQEYLTSLTVEAERQRQANARDQFGANVNARDAESQFGLSRFQAGGSEAGRLAGESISRFGAAQAAGQNERSWVLDQARTQADISTQRQQQQLAQEGQAFDQTMRSYQEGRATQQQLEDQALKYAQFQQQIQTSELEQYLSVLQTNAQLTQAEAAEVRESTKLVMAYQQQQQSAVLELLKLVDSTDVDKTTQLIQLFQTSGSLIESALNRAANIAQTNSEIASTNNQQTAYTREQGDKRTGGIFSGIAGIFSGM